METQGTLFRTAAGATWHVDIYCGLLQGVILAEVELKDATQELIIPDWVGKEVTGDPSYRKVNMRARALELASARGRLPSNPRQAGDRGPI
jgi:adenylate cyclase